MRLARSEHLSLESLSTYLDQELSSDEREWVETHLEGCAKCRQRLDDLQGVVGGLRSLRRVEPPQTLGLWVSHRIDLEGHRESLMDRLEGRLRGFSGPQSNILPLFAIILLLAVVSYLFASALDRQNRVITPVYFPGEGGVLIDNRTPLPPPPVGHIITAAGRYLAWDGERWIEEGLGLDDLASARTVLVDSPEGRRLLAEGSELAEMAKARRPVMVRIGHEVIELRGAEPVPLSPAPPTLED